MRHRMVWVAAGALAAALALHLPAHLRGLSARGRARRGAAAAWLMPAGVPVGSPQTPSGGNGARSSWWDRTWRVLFPWAPVPKDPFRHLGGSHAGDRYHRWGRAVRRRRHWRYPIHGPEGRGRSSSN